MLLLPVLLLVAVPVMSQDLDELLVQVGQEYAEAYTEPIVHGVGANQNTALFHTAYIPESTLTFSIGVKFMGTYLNESDQTFRKTLTDVELNDYLDLEEGDPGYGERGDIVMQGPTAMGDTNTKGTATAYVDGVPIYTMTTITGVADTRWVPLAAPEFQIGGIVGLKASVRYMPPIKLSKYGETSYLGYGLQWSPNFLLPDLPVDLMAGFFIQSIDVGEFIETDAQSIHIAASQTHGLATIYLGAATENSTMKVDYSQIDTGTPVSFETDGRMTARATVGATFDLGVLVNAEMGIGKMVVYNIGIMFGM